jgi:hypothetical protein
MEKAIGCFYIEYADYGKLENLLNDNGFAFYDATPFKTLYGLNTLEEIEAFLEFK